MFEEEIEAILEILKSNDPFAQSSFFYDEEATEHNSYEGIPDPKQYKTFAQLVQVGKGESLTKIKDCEYNYSGNFKVVCGISCLNAKTAIKSICAQIIEGLNQFAANVTIRNVSKKSFLIYFEETKNKLQDKDLKLIRIEFSLSEKASFSGCDKIKCNEGCC